MILDIDVIPTTRSSNQLNKLNNLVVELLDISKMESGNLTYNFAEFSFEDFMANTIDVFQRSNPGWNIVRNGIADIQLCADEFRMEQVILNYLSNAIKYSEASSDIQLNVALTEQDAVKISVKDNGIGISKSEQPFLFDKFYRVAQSSHKYQGLGMGLYICAEIIQKHGGTYGVESDLGEGSTFYFTLPIHQNTQHYNQ